jgi:hypothetical protein
VHSSELEPASAGKVFYPELTMLLTEAESSRRICPLTLANPEGASTCRGSGCLAWRYRSAIDADGFRGTQHTADQGAATGYCGLVGGNPHESH